MGERLLAMKMKKMTDVALMEISEKDLGACRDALRKIRSAKWSMAFSERSGRALLRRPASKRSRPAAARDLESSLTKAVPSLEGNLRWAWSSGDSTLYFPTGDIFVLFENGTSQAKRKRILDSIKGIQIHTYPDIEDTPPKNRGGQRYPEGFDIPGFSGSGGEKAREALNQAMKKVERKPTPERPARVRVPAARVSVPTSRLDEIFDIAQKVAGLSGVLAATPDYDVLGENVLGEPQLTSIPGPTPDMTHQKNLVAPAWCLVDPADLGVAPGDFLASKEMVAVIDYTFVDQPYISYNLVGFDAADGDYDPRTPTSDVDPHGMLMCGVIGGQYRTPDEIGIAPGTVLVPVRPSWRTEEDYQLLEGGLTCDEFHQYVERFTANWVQAILRLWQLSHLGLEIANMSIALDVDFWMASGISAWINWWLMSGNSGEGVFACASAGNNPAITNIAAPARAAKVFAVGWGEYLTGTMLGCTGPGLEIVANDGLWPMYTPSGAVERENNGGTSVASAVVAGTVSIMKSMNHLLTADEIKDILRLTTRKAPGQDAMEDEDGYCTQFGWGFLNADYAIEVVWRNRYLASELFHARYRPVSVSPAMIQLRHKSSSPFRGKRMGAFWALFSDGAANSELYWNHDRDRQLRHFDQAIDATGAPFGELTAPGDFDGDGMDEIALQLDGDAYWPEFTAAPAHSFLVYKHEVMSGKWNPLGGRSPYASGLASPQIVFPGDHDMDGVVTADLMGDGSQCLVAWQEDVINALRYDVASDTFVRLTPVNFSPPVYSEAIDNATGTGSIHHPHIHQMVNIGRVGRCDALLCLATFRKSLLPSVVPSVSRTFLTAFVVAYDTLVSEWHIWPLSGDPSDTHILLDRIKTSDIEGLLTGDFSSTDNPAHVQAVVHAYQNHLYYMTLHRRDVISAFSGYAVYKQKLVFEGKLSPLRVGNFGFGGAAANLAWLSDSEHGNQVRFLKWNDPLREWQELDVVLSHDRKDNRAIDLAVLKGFSFENLNGNHDTIALLMELPDANIHKSYRWNLEEGAFQDMGVL
jgi:hypothetical protein